MKRPGRSWPGAPRRSGPARAMPPSTPPDRDEAGALRGGGPRPRVREAGGSLRAPRRRRCRRCSASIRTPSWRWPGSRTRAMEADDQAVAFTAGRLAELETVSRDRAREALAEGVEAPRAKEALLDVKAEVRAAGGVVLRRVDGHVADGARASASLRRLDVPEGEAARRGVLRGWRPPRSARGDGPGVSDRRRAAASRTTSTERDDPRSFATG